MKKRAPMIAYSEVFKRNVIDKYLVTGLPKLIVQRKHGIKFKSAIVTWMKQLGYASECQKVSILRFNKSIRID